MSDATFRRSVHFEPGYNHLDETGPKARGQHGMGIRFILVGPEGAVTLLMNTGWVPPHPDHAITPRKYETIEPLVHPNPRSWDLYPTGSHIGFHWATDPDVYTSSIGPSRCQYLGPGKECWFDAGYGMSDPVVGELIKKGDAAVWRALLGYYKHRRDAIEAAWKEQG